MIYSVTLTDNWTHNSDKTASTPERRNVSPIAIRSVLFRTLLLICVCQDCSYFCIIFVLSVYHVFYVLYLPWWWINVYIIAFGLRPLTSDAGRLFDNGHSHGEYLSQVSWKSLHWVQRYHSMWNRC